MQPKAKPETEELKTEDTGVILRWGKFITRVTAISATITGAFAALFSSSSVTSGITLTAAGASTLAAAEKLPDPRYIKTKHVPPKPLPVKGRKVTLQPDILPKPEKISASPLSRPTTRSSDTAMRMRATTFTRTKV